MAKKDLTASKEDEQYEDIVEINTDEPGTPAIVVDNEATNDHDEILADGPESVYPIIGQLPAEDFQDDEQWVMVDGEEIGIDNLFVDPDEIVVDEPHSIPFSFEQEDMDSDDDSLDYDEPDFDEANADDISVGDLGDDLII